jgi:hypothetical protein
LETGKESICSILVDIGKETIYESMIGPSDVISAAASGGDLAIAAAN